MNCSPTQRHTHKKPFTFRLLFLLIILLYGAPPLAAQASEEDFRGSWQLEAPNGDGIVIIIKKEARASYFSIDTPDRSVTQGTWLKTDNGAQINWPDGSIHHITPKALGFETNFIEKSGNILYTIATEKIPKDVLGQWAKPPKSETAKDSDRDKAKGFFGIWRVDGPLNTTYFTIEPDRSAASTFGFQPSGKRGLRGEWAKQGSELHIAWDSGHYSILREGERGFTYKQIEPGTIIEFDETKFIAASRTTRDNLPNNWQTLYDEERKNYSGGITFASRKNALKFYRGDWLIRLSEASYEKIDIGRFGGLSSSRSKDLGGDWLMTGQDIFMRWENGIRKILSPIGLGFIVYEYRPGRPLDGVPTRLLPAAPANPNKLKEYLSEQKDVTDHLRALATAAGVAPNTQPDGWGNTFMRWAWPFGGDGYITQSDLIIEESISNKTYNDPWWWPVWSETALAEKTVVSNKTSEREKPPTVSQTEKINPKKEGAKPKKKSWFWPY